ncbi:MAG TPA: hypothetical protein VFE50_01340 [Cyclobacteriaceae bacterium]|nr:hypothetical protein [Cyclobacteriaceae bacterium]
MKNWAAIILLFIIGSCCTKMVCPCVDQVIIDFRLDPSDNFSATEANAFYIVTTNKEFVPIDSMDFNFPFNIMQTHGDQNFLVKNSLTGKVDTISKIAYIPKDSTFECNDCILKKDIQHCTLLTSRELNHNGEKVKGFTVYIGK